MKLYQLTDSDGNNFGLFTTNRTDGNIEKDVEKALEVAKAREQHYIENEYEEEIYLPDEFEAELEKVGIYRVYLEATIQIEI